MFIATKTTTTSAAKKTYVVCFPLSIIFLSISPNGNSFYKWFTELHACFCCCLLFFSVLQVWFVRFYFTLCHTVRPPPLRHCRSYILFYLKNTDTCMLLTTLSSSASSSSNLIFGNSIALMANAFNILS